MIRQAARMLATMYCVCTQPAHSTIETLEVVPPLSFALFCIQYPEECEEQPDRRITNFQSRGQRWRELNQINSTVNVAIVPKKQVASQLDHDWQIFPFDGNCSDYAVTKRHLLLRAGWPSSSLLLAEVIIRASGEHHFVLLAREGRSVFVLDNLSTIVIELNEALDKYVLVRTESDRAPRLWVRTLAAFLVARLGSRSQRAAFAGCALSRRRCLAAWGQAPTQSRPPQAINISK